MQKQKVYQFQCQRCYLISGHISRNSEDAPVCCGGEPMIALEINTKESDKIDVQTLQR